MEYLDGKSIILYARSIAPSLGKKERLIVNFISNNYKQIPKMSISEMARHFEVSEASITKACKKLKCNGFLELKRSIESYIKKMQDEPKNFSDQESFNETDNPAQILEKVFINSIVAIQDTYAGINADDFAKAASMLAKADKIILIGSGGSGILCQDFQHKLLKIGILAIMFPNENMQLMAASLANSKDVVMGISHSGKTKSAIYALRSARQQGAHTLCLTNHAMSPITSVAEISLYSSARNAPITGENASARLAQLNILDALYTTLALSRTTTSYQNLKKTKESVLTKRT